MQADLVKRLLESSSSGRRRHLGHALTMKMPVDGSDPGSHQTPLWLQRLVASAFISGQCVQRSLPRRQRPISGVRDRCPSQHAAAHLPPHPTLTAPQSNHEAPLREQRRVAISPSKSPYTLRRRRPRRPFALRRSWMRLVSHYSIQPRPKQVQSIRSCGMTSAVYPVSPIVWLFEHNVSPKEVSDAEMKS